MPRTCTVCSHPLAAAINKELARSATKESVSVRFGVSASATQRHRSGCLQIRSKQQPAKRGAPGLAERSEPVEARFDTSEPKSLVRTTARLVDQALDLLEGAKRAGDRRTALAALREARDGLQLLMRVGGMLAGDAPTTDNRTVNVFQGWDPADIRRVLQQLGPEPTAAPRSLGDVARNVVAATDEPVAITIDGGPLL